MSRNIVIYQSGEIELKVSVDNETIWLDAEDVATLFDVQRPAIVKHIGNIYKAGELSKTLTCSILEQVTKDGKKRKKNYYNLDVIISVGYRVNSLKATHFRMWATSVLKNYILNGYAVNSDKITHQRFKELENDVLLLKYQMSNISQTLEDKSIKPTQGIFYNGEIFDAYLFITNLIRTAKKSLVLIDNYVDDTVLTMFTKRLDGVSVTIYTNKISKDLALDLKKYNQQYPSIEVKVFQEAHDRFLIIDGQSIYHIGASLKDLGKKWIAFSKMTNSAVKMLHKLNHQD